MMMKKGVSAIIATILLLMITIGLAGTAYIFMSGLLTGKTSKAIEISDVSCTNNRITLVVSNDGTSTIADGEIKIFINNRENTTEFSGIDPITPHNTTVAVGSTTVFPSGSVNSILVISPSNSDRRTVYC